MDLKEIDEITFIWWFMFSKKRGEFKKDGHVCRLETLERKQVWVKFTFVHVIELEVLVRHLKGGAQESGLELQKYIWVQFLN